jgi:hypothetical protein
MSKDFAPDIMIGVNAGGDPEVPVEDNILSQVKNIVVASREYTMPSEKDILITPNISQFGVFEFGRVKAAIDSGYAATMRKMDKIKASISRRQSAEEMKKKRSDFHVAQEDIFIDKIIVKGLTEAQAKYVKNVLNPGNDCISLEQLKKSFFRLYRMIM